MTSDGQPVERLRDYLRTLKPEARAMLVAELERGLLQGEESAGSELILQELRRAIRVEGRPVTRIGDAARLFFAPVEPFLIDDAPTTSGSAALRGCRLNRSGSGSVAI